MLSLQAMDTAEISAWYDRLAEGYLEHRVAAGDEREVARRGIARNRADFFPNEQPAPGQLLFRLIEDGQPVGSLWIGTMPDRPPEQWWVWSIEIEAPFRRRGLGRAAMELAEIEARRGGAHRLGLNVAGSNAAARSLYESLGYETVELQMNKTL